MEPFQGNTEKMKKYRCLLSVLVLKPVNIPTGSNDNYYENYVDNTQQCHNYCTLFVLYKITENLFTIRSIFYPEPFYYFKM